MKMYPTPEMILEAAVTLRGVARQTPVLPFGRQGGTLFLKAENLQETGSFKIRGAYNKLSSLTAEEASKGVDRLLRRDPSCWRKELVPRPSPPACTTGSTQA